MFRRTVLCLSSALALAATASVPAAAATGDPGFCGIPTGQTNLVKNIWTGAAGDGAWVTPTNWSLNRAPDTSDANTGYVCIDAKATVSMPAGAAAEIQMLDVAPGTTLAVGTGAMLFVSGDKQTRPTYLRAGSTTINSGAFGGPGQINLDGTLAWRSELPGAAALGTRRCHFLLPIGCDSDQPALAGTMLVRDQGSIAVDGLGVRLEDGYQLDVRGLVKLTGFAFVGGTPGTVLRLTPKQNGGGVGTLQFANNGSWVQTSVPGRPGRIVNNGRIMKTSGTGVSVVTAQYSGRGTAAVSRGRLTLPDNSATLTRVSPGSSVGFGHCVPAQGGCLNVTTAWHPQAATVTVPSTQRGATALSVRRDATPRAGHQIGRTVTVKAPAGYTTSRRDPAVLRLDYDATLVGQKTVNTLTISTAPDAARTFTRVPNCTAGALPAGKSSCVDRAASSTLPGGGLSMVVRTTHFSRWHAS